jgi:hypothetical protein
VVSLGRPKGESVLERENLAPSSSGQGPASVPSGARSRPFASGPRPFETVGSKIGDTELVDAAARAMLNGRGELAEFLMREVRQRRERPAGNVVPIPSTRPA